MTLLKDTSFICLDTETTGLDPEKDRIVEIAACRFTLAEIVDSFDSLVQPQMAISEESLRIHQITPEMVKDSPTFDLIAKEFLEFVGDSIIVGHGIAFDISLIIHEARRYNVLCSLKKNRLFDTLRLARFYGDSPNNSLKNLAHHFNVEQMQAHRAMHDVKMNIEVFKHLVARQKTVEDVIKILARPIKIKYMPLGKYKGRLFSEVPVHYLKWASNMKFDEDLLYSIRLELKKRKSGNHFSQASNPFQNL